MTQSIKIRKVIYIIIFLSILGTYSVSALVILPIVVIIIPFAILNGLIKLRFKSFVLAIALLIIFTILIIYYANIETSRLGYYLLTYQNILEKNSFSNFTFDERTQLPNILPLIEFLKSCSTYLTYHCFIGHGLGSAAFLNANLEFGGLTNPFSDFIRLTYDIGIFGLFMYVAYFMALIKRVSLHRVHQLKGSEIQIFWTILTFCACLAHRSFAIWLLLMFMYQFSVRTELDKKKIYSKLNKVLIFKIIYKDVKDNAGRGTEKNIIT